MEDHKTEVTIVGIKMPFWSMIVFMVKWAIASIPAIFILAFVGYVSIIILRIIKAFL